MEKGIDYPEWFTEGGLNTISKGYLLKGENVFDAYQRVAHAAAINLEKPELEQYFYEALIKNWLCPASPVLSNLGTTRALPISCFGIDIGDSIYKIASGSLELMMLTKSGGGVGIGLSRIRGRGSLIKNNGHSEGVIPWSKRYDTDILSTNQGSVRRGAASVNLNVEHDDVDEFLRIRRAQGDVNRQCLNLNHCIQITDGFMERMLSGGKKEQELWINILKTRFETGEPYLHFIDTTNRNKPEAYKNNNLDVSMTNICSEITLYTDEDHSFVCCLSSLNLTRFEEWEKYKFDNGMTLPELGIWFLDGVLQDFINRGQHIQGLEKAVRSAEKGRALGLGVLGWHTFLQRKELPFIGFQSMKWTNRIFKFIKSEAEKASRDLAIEYGEPEWCQGTGKRNSHLLALAPTVSNSVISGGVSASIEPIRANCYNLKGAKGVSIVKNQELENLLKQYGHNTKKVWQSILENRGSVQHLTMLTEEQKEVFLTFPEISQLEIVRQAAARQKYLDQAQSINLCFPENVDPKYFHRVHVDAWKLGLNTLYYCRALNHVRGDMASRQYKEADMCKSCEG